MGSNFHPSLEDFSYAFKDYTPLFMAAIIVGSISVSVESLVPLWLIKAMVWA